MVEIPCCGYVGVGRKVGWTLTFIKAVQSRGNPIRAWVLTMELMAQEKEHIIEPTEEK